MNRSKAAEERFWIRWAKAGAVRADNCVGSGNGFVLLHVFSPDGRCLRCGQRERPGISWSLDRCPAGRGWDAYNMRPLPWLAVRDGRR